MYGYHDKNTEHHKTRCIQRHNKQRSSYFFLFSVSDVHRKNVVSNIGKSSVWALWQNDQYKTHSTSQKKYTKSQKTFRKKYYVFFMVSVRLEKNIILIRFTAFCKDFVHNNNINGRDISSHIVQSCICMLNNDLTEEGSI